MDIVDTVEFSIEKIPQQPYTNEPFNESMIPNEFCIMMNEARWVLTQSHGPEFAMEWYKNQVIIIANKLGKKI